MKAIWSRIQVPEGGEAPFIEQPWLWYPLLRLNAPVEPALLSQLRAKEWKPLKKARMGICLMGQLFPLYESAVSGGQRQWLVRDTDLAKVTQYPVALGFRLPPHLSPETSELYVNVETPLPPSLLGEVGVVCTENSLIVYPIEELPREGKLHCQHIKGILEEHAGETTLEKWIAVTQAIREPVQQLVELYWQHHKNKRKLPEPQNTFVGKTHVPIPATLPVQAVLAAYSNAASTAASRWKPDKESNPHFEYVNQEGIVLVELRPPKGRRVVDDAASNSLWKKVRQLGDRDGDVLLAILAHYLSVPSDDKEGYVSISGSLILDYRGIAPITKVDPASKVKRRAGHRQEDLQSVSDCFDRIIDTWVTVAQISQVTGTRRRVARKKHPLMMVKTIYQQEESLISNNDSEDDGGAQGSEDGDFQQRPLLPSLQKKAYNIAWEYRPGPWYREGKHYNKAIAFLCKQALRYDLVGEAWERRLARLFLFKLRLHALGGGSIVVTIRSLFDELSLPINERDPEKTRKRFEKAMLRLVKDKEIDAWGPVDENPALPSIKWLPVWLDWKIIVSVAPLIALREEFASVLKRKVAQSLSLSQNQMQHLLEEKSQQHGFAEGLHQILTESEIALSRFHTLSLRAFQEISEKVIDAGDTTQDIIAEAIRQFKREPEQLDAFIAQLFLGEGDHNEDELSGGQEKLK